MKQSEWKYVKCIFYWLEKGKIKYDLNISCIKWDCFNQNCFHILFGQTLIGSEVRFSTWTGWANANYPE